VPVSRVHDAGGVLRYRQRAWTGVALGGGLTLTSIDA
jgi:hypothetical protein